MAASYIFFFINSQYLVLVLFAETLVTFFTGLAIEKHVVREKDTIKNLEEPYSKEYVRSIQSKGKKYRKQIMMRGVLIVLLTLLFLKYYNFFLKIINPAAEKLSFSIPTLHLLLPIGISFYSLQAIAYMVDVYRGKIHADTNLLKFMLFMSYFPQIVQGPIPRYKQLANQLYESHDFDLQRFYYGVQLILWGFLKKLVIADRIAIAANEIFNNPGSYHGLIVFFGAACYGLQVYADFSGGMDIARGFSQIIGIELELNFTQPYFAVSVEDFWRRWHITLGSFMRDYVFYPLSLSKCFANLGKKSRKIFGNTIGKKIPSFIAMFIVYFLVGFWHGPEWKYVAYGIWNGFFIAGGILLTEPFAKLKRLLHIDETLFSWRLFQIVRTFIIVSFGRIFSRAASLKTAVGMFHSFTKDWYLTGFIFDGTLNKLGLSTGDWFLLIFMIQLLILVAYFNEKGFFIRGWIEKQGIVFEVFLFTAAFFCVLILGIYGIGYDTSSFIYASF